MDPQNALLIETLMEDKRISREQYQQNIAETTDRLYAEYQVLFAKTDRLYAEKQVLMAEKLVLLEQIRELEAKLDKKPEDKLDKGLEAKLDKGLETKLDKKPEDKLEDKGLEAKLDKLEDK